MSEEKTQTDRRSGNAIPEFYSFECDVCGDDTLFARDENEFEDGEMETCHECGTMWMISADSESQPYVVRQED